MISYFHFDSEAELLQQLDIELDFNGIVLKDDCEKSTKNIMIKINNDSQSVCLGLMSFDGITPRIVQVNDLLFIGYNHSLAIIKNNIIVEKYNVDSAFFDFLIVGEKVVSVFEIDLICFSIDGHIKWKYYASDIITEYRLNNDFIDLSFFDSESKKVSIETGKEVKM